jgi:hypothetical protein
LGHKFEGDEDIIDLEDPNYAPAKTLGQTQTFEVPVRDVAIPILPLGNNKKILK